MNFNPAQFHADLHCHSSCSDGSFTAEELVEEAVKASLQGLSITDHDTVEAYRTAVDAAKKLQLPIISGVEFSAFHEETSVHILGYAFSLKHPAVLELCQRHAERRQTRNTHILQQLAKLNMPITLEELQQGAHNVIGRPHIALAMVKKGYVTSVSEAFKRYIGEGRPAYAKGDMISVEETIETIHKAHGIAIIAHPHLIREAKLLEKLVEMPFDGIECYYARFAEESNSPFMAIAKKKNWLITGGSDFHGSFTPNLHLGTSWIGEEHFRLLERLYFKNNPCPTLT